MSELTIKIETNGDGESNRATYSFFSTNEPETQTLYLTSNSGYSDVYSDVYAGPSSFRPTGRHVLIIPASTNTDPIYVSPSSTSWGVKLSSRDASVLPTETSVLYVASTGSTQTHVTVMSI